MSDKYAAIEPSPGYIAARVVDRQRPKDLVEIDLADPQSWMRFIPRVMESVQDQKETALICEVIKSRADENAPVSDAKESYEPGDVIVLKEYTGAKFQYEDTTIVMCQSRDIAGKLNLEVTQSAG